MMAGKIFYLNGRLTEWGSCLNDEAFCELRGYFKQGSPHEVAAMLHTVIEDLRCETILNNADRKDSE